LSSNIFRNLDGDEVATTTMSDPVNRLNFTKANIENLPLPSVGWKYYYDTKVAGLAVGVGASGLKTFVLYKKINRRPERLKIGRVADLTVDEARKQAEKLNGEVAVGSNPADAKRKLRDEITFGDMFDRYYKEHSVPFKKTAVEDQAKFEKYLSDRKYSINLAKRRLSEISIGDLKMLFASISAEHPITANRVLALVSSVFTTAIQDELYGGSNPCRGLKRNQENKRKRFLMPDELPAFFQALSECPSPTTRDYIMMSLLTGARRSNVLEMRWSEIFLNRGEWEIPMTKNGTSQRIPLVKDALVILAERRANPTYSGSQFVFPGTGASGHLTEPKKAWKTILKKADLTDLRLHDLRRTFGSWQAGTGSNLSIIGRSLNHKSLATTKVYDQLWLDPVRDSMETAVSAMFKAGGRSVEESLVVESKSNQHK
jgi:integrase